MSKTKQRRSRLIVSIAMCISVVSVWAAAPAFKWQPQVSGVTVRLRGVSAVSPTVAWASGAGGTLLRTIDGGAHWTLVPPPTNAAKLDFRDIDAVSEKVAYALSIGSGTSSRIYKTDDAGAHWVMRLANSDPKVFLDAMAFTDPQHGFVFGDSVDGRFFILTTATGGDAWDRVPVEKLPRALEGEGAFAASGTNVAVFGHHVWIGTTKSRVLHSADDGKTWTIAATPMATGNATGIFSIAFRDALHGVVVGGDYQKETAAVDNVAITADGGATWTLAKGLTGFRSVVAWVPGEIRSLIAIGPAGADWSADEGKTWTPIALSAAPGQPVGFDTFAFAPGGKAGWAAGQGGRISRVVSP